uniref:hypothetical protein n=1 Tax=Enterocloster clostridioformis TaxID=1531 RepID=UPI003A95728C
IFPVSSHRSSFLADSNARSVFLLRNTCPCDCKNLINEQGIIDNLNEELDLINNIFFSKDFSTPWGFIKNLSIHSAAWLFSP